VPLLRALLDDQALLPQQAVQQLSFVERQVNMVLVNLTDPKGEKYRKLKLSGVRTKVRTKPEHAEALLKAAGFALTPGTDFLEWFWVGQGTSNGTLAASLAMLVLIARVCKRAEKSGMRSLAEPLDASIDGRDLAHLRYGDVDLLESQAPLRGPQKVGAVSGALMPRVWLEARLPQVANVLEDVCKFIDVGTREKVATKAIARAINDRRDKSAKPLEWANTLGKVAQLVAGMILVAMRRPEMCVQPTTPAEEALTHFLAATEPDGEPASQGCVTDAGDAPAAAVEPSNDDASRMDGEASPKKNTERLCGVEVLEQTAVPLLLECIPAFRFGLPHRTSTEIAYLREFPAFFTSSPYDKPFEVSLAELAKRLAEAYQPLVSEEASVLGLGCAIDLGHDDKAVICLIVA